MHIRYKYHWPTFILKNELNASSASGFTRSGLLLTRPPTQDDPAPFHRTLAPEVLSFLDVCSPHMRV